MGEKCSRVRTYAFRRITPPNRCRQWEKAVMKATAAPMECPPRIMFLGRMPVAIIMILDPNVFLCLQIAALVLTAFDFIFNDICNVQASLVQSFVVFVNVGTLDVSNDVPRGHLGCQGTVMGDAQRRDK
jgi:hypothetical protein